MRELLASERMAAARGMKIIGQLLGLDRTAGFGAGSWPVLEVVVGSAGGRRERGSAGLRENLGSLESKLSFSLGSLKSEFGFGSSNRFFVLRGLNL